MHTIIDELFGLKYMKKLPDDDARSLTFHFVSENIYSRIRLLPDLPQGFALLADYPGYNIISQKHNYCDLLKLLLCLLHALGEVIDKHCLG
jgi:hypothetical protein